jgi:hypothetical protein
MRRTRALKRHRQQSRLIPILLAGGVGYLLGSAQITALRSTDLSAAEAVALRFPQDWRNAAPNAAPENAAARRATAAPGISGTRIVGRSDASGMIRDAQLALLSPQPIDPLPMAAMLPTGPGLPSADEAASQFSMQMATAKAVDTRLAALPSMSVQSKPASGATAPTPAQAVLPRKSAAAQRRSNDHPGHMFNDAQIASIRQRLNLTPDQERMWPAVEAALRNMTYTHTSAARPRGANWTQVAAVDPNAVEGLKSAAVPLLMSFNDEQKEQVRNLARVIGLDEFASQF